MALVHTLTPEIIAALPAIPTPHSRRDAAADRSARCAARALPLPDACAACGLAMTINPGNRRPTVQWHHPDYGHPTACVALCLPCHHLTHTGKIREAITGRWWLNFWGVTSPQWDEEARAYAASVTGPYRATSMGKREWAVHRRAIDLGLIVMVGKASTVRYWPAHLALVSA